MTNLKDIKSTKELCLADNCDNYLTDRVEKLGMAIYLVTDLLTDTEPIKFELRNKNIKLLSVIKNDRKAVSFIKEIDGLLKIAYMAQLISKMNYSILNIEYGKLLNLIRGNKQIILTDKLFEEDSKGQIDKGHSIGQSKGQPKLSDRKVVKDTLKKTKQMKKREINRDRRSLVIKFIKDKQDASIKDILNVVDDCSIKTLQRDLVSLVQEGVLKKEREKRWTKYSLNL